MAGFDLTIEAPSRRQKRLTEYQQRARQLGLHVEAGDIEAQAVLLATALTRFMCDNYGRWLREHTIFLVHEGFASAAGWADFVHEQAVALEALRRNVKHLEALAHRGGLQEVLDDTDRHFGWDGGREMARLFCRMAYRCAMDQLDLGAPGNHGLGQSAALLDLLVSEWCPE